ncbi:MAG: SAM-dependent methyltransferase [Caulobacterales bacterium 68-7]|nr:methyltransferase domain-containing protein [Caulobacterales bacterium]OJU11022.1 MAG: SAM-dependent methyltransferase [Caulobacterales bacterium 68-7]
MSEAAKPGVLTGAQWKDAMGRAWAALHPVLERMNRPVGEATAARAGVAPGDRVLDVGCGTGDTSLDLARRAGHDGRCLGVDISATLLDSARKAADAAGVANVAFLEADAQTHAFAPGSFDVVYSRFGVMFFDDPDAAFANLRRAAAPGGRLAFTCWRKPQDNPLSTIAVDAARPFLPPIPPPTPGAPGRFAFADPDRVRGILERSGWKDIEIEALDAPTPASLDEMMALNLDLGMLGPILRDQPEAVRAQVHEAVGAAFAPHVVDGVVPMTAACWLVSARA